MSYFWPSVDLINQTQVAFALLDLGRGWLSPTAALAAACHAWDAWDTK